MLLIEAERAQAGEWPACVKANKIKKSGSRTAVAFPDRQAATVNAADGIKVMSL